MRLLAPDHIHMDFIGNNPHTMTLAQVSHDLQLIARPHFPGRILWATQEHNFTFWFRQHGFQLAHIAKPVVSLLL